MREMDERDCQHGWSDTQQAARDGASLDLLREAVRERRECHKAYSEFIVSLGKRFPTADERAKEVALRSALGLAERAVMDAAELLTPNAK